MTHRNFKFPFQQRGASIVEFAFIALMFFTLLFGIVEFGRLFFTINSVQEITRRAAREQVVRWVTTTDMVKREAMLQPGSTGTVYYPGAIDITNDQVQLSFYNCYPDPDNEDCTEITTLPGSSQENVNNCLIGDDSCIRFVRATLSNSANPSLSCEQGSLVNFNVLAPFMPSNVFRLPCSTVIMPAEALGLM